MAIKQITNLPLGGVGRLDGPRPLRHGVLFNRCRESTVGLQAAWRRRVPACAQPIRSRTQVQRPMRDVVDDPVHCTTIRTVFIIGHADQIVGLIVKRSLSVRTTGVGQRRQQGPPLLAPDRVELADADLENDRGTVESELLLAKRSIRPRRRTTNAAPALSSSGGGDRTWQVDLGGTTRRWFTVLQFHQNAMGFIPVTTLNILIATRGNRLCVAWSDTPT